MNSKANKRAPNLQGAVMTMKVTNPGEQKSSERRGGEGRKLS